jgi:hypothetical protein
MVMQNEISDTFNSLLSQNLGMTDPASVFGLCLAAPGVIMFFLLFFGRQLFRPRWRGYWDAV